MIWELSVVAIVVFVMESRLCLGACSGNGGNLCAGKRAGASGFWGGGDFMLSELTAAGLDLSHGFGPDQAEMCALSASPGRALGGCVSACF